MADRPHQQPEPRVSAVTIRCTPSERKAIEGSARDAGQTLSEYVLRSSVYAARVRSHRPSGVLSIGGRGVRRSAESS
jgi:hypothetical protein